ncbi:hypothetical protein CcaverHIS002_0211420 [Cutaneotrichosporon cavernicola]|nr:hypothetical protein CcaverHIS002_0211420 [Cutaneotrichosporon cavernicola]
MLRPATFRSLARVPNMRAVSAANAARWYASSSDKFVRIVERLLDSGLKTIEVGSFVRADRVPQMADTPQLLPQLPSLAKAGLLELDKGQERLTNEIAVFVSATEPFSKANNNASVDKVLSGLPAVIDQAKGKYRVRGYVSCVMTDPYAGPTDPKDVVKVARKLLDMGCYEVSLGDTTGEGNPEAWKKLWQALIDEGIPVEKMAAHCHDTFAMAVPSILALLPMGLRIVDSSLAGLGGCPYSPGATGNVATEDVVYALHKLGYQTGVDLDKLVEDGNWLCSTIGIRNESKVGRALGARQALKKKKEAEAAAASHFPGRTTERLASLVHNGQLPRSSSLSAIDGHYQPTEATDSPVDMTMEVESSSSSLWEYSEFCSPPSPTPTTYEEHAPDGLQTLPRRVGLVVLSLSLPAKVNKQDSQGAPVKH